MKMVKRTLIAIAVVALLASATQALSSIPLCEDIPVYMYVDGEVEKLYFDCEKFEVKANFNAKLSLSIDVIDPEFTVWDFYFDGGDTVPGDEAWHTLKVCVWNWKPKKLSGDPGTQVKIGTVTISVMPQTVDEAMSVGYYIQVKNCSDHKFVLKQYVDIDIKPGSDPNPINQGSKGLVPVAILSSEDFDATTVDPATVELAGATVAVRGKDKYMAHKKDVNGDGLVDILVQVETQGFDDLGAGGIVELTGTTFGGGAIVGYDEVIIVPPDK
jgi:hypothetical protein